jgi:phospholipid/cholesterol/gamma-HCH transport system permease protein
MGKGSVKPAPPNDRYDRRMVEAPVVAVDAALDRDSVARMLRDLEQGCAAGPSRLVLDLGRVERFDSAGLGGIVEGLRRARERGIDVRLRGMSQPMLDFFSLVSVERLLEARAPEPGLDPISRLGASILPALGAIAGIGSMTLAVAHGVFVAPFQHKRLRFDRTVAEIDNAAIGALPIVGLISLLLGLVLAMQAWVQLRVWGAEIYVADMVGVSIVSEIGPLMTAIVLAARSGSSNAAQLGAMVVGEEVDALVQMGVHPVRFLVVPKVLALAFSVVALGIVFDIVGMFGGMVFAYAVADIHPSAYVAQTQTALRLGDLSIALLKSVAFGICIGVVSCSLGLRVQGGSEGVGRATTNAVVLGIFLIIVVDTVFVTLQRMVLA